MATATQTEPLQLTTNIAVPKLSAKSAKRKLPDLDIEAYNGGTMRVAKYDFPVIVDLSEPQNFKGLDGETNVEIRRDHDSSRLIGYGTATVQDGKSIQFRGKLLSAKASNGESEQVRELAADGFPLQASIGLEPTRSRRLKSNESEVINGRVVEGPAHVVEAGELLEISVVIRGADSSTSTKVSGKRKELSDTEKRDQLIIRALDAGTPSHVLEKVLAKEATLGLSVLELETELIKASRHDREQANLAAIRYNQRTGSNLKEDSATLRRSADLICFNGQLADSGSKVVQVSTLEAAFAMYVGDSATLKQYDETTLQKAEDEFGIGGISIRELAVGFARSNGHDIGTHREIRAALIGAYHDKYGRRIKAATSGASTYDLSGLLSNVCNKMIRAGFEAVESTWRPLAEIQNLQDFKPHTSYSLSSDLKYKKLANGGEIEQGKISEAEKSTNQLDDYGRLFSVTRNDIKNDDAGAFRKVRTLVGRGAALAFNEVFWTEFLDNLASFWTAARGNFLSGPGSELSIDGLSSAVTAVCEQTDPEGNPLGILPKYLVVPNALKILANSLTKDPEIRISGGTDESYTTTNPHAGTLTAIASSYLNAAKIPGGSATRWFLMPDPQDMPVMQVGFLNGQQMPVVEQMEADFDTLALQIRGIHTFGITKSFWRGSLASEGV